MTKVKDLRYVPNPEAFRQLVTMMPVLANLEATVRCDRDRGGVLPLLVDKDVPFDGIVPQDPVDPYIGPIENSRMNYVFDSLLTLSDKNHASSPYAIRNTNADSIAREYLYDLATPGRSFGRAMWDERADAIEDDPGGRPPQTGSRLARSAWKAVGVLSGTGSPTVALAIDRVILSCMRDEDDRAVVDDVRSILEHGDRDVWTALAIRWDEDRSVPIASAMTTSFVTHRIGWVLRAATGRRGHASDREVSREHFADELRFARLGIRAAFGELVRAVPGVEPKLVATQELRDRVLGQRGDVAQWTAEVLQDLDSEVRDGLDRAVGPEARDLHGVYGSAIAWRVAYFALTEYLIRGDAYPLG